MKQAINYWADEKLKAHFHKHKKPRKFPSTLKTQKRTKEKQVEPFELGEEEDQLNSVMEIDHHQQDDPFLKFIDYARSVLCPEDDEDLDPNVNGSDTKRPTWNWIASRILKTCSAYSSGVTAAILLSDLSQVSFFSISIYLPLFGCQEKEKKKKKIQIFKS